jgi:hypothetical protein
VGTKTESGVCVCVCAVVRESVRFLFFFLSAQLMSTLSTQNKSLFTLFLNKRRQPGFLLRKTGNIPRHTSKIIFLNKLNLKAGTKLKETVSRDV